MTDLILTEKYSVAADFAKALGIRKKEDGFFQGDAFVIAWAVGHLVELFEPEDYDAALKKWRLDTLPILPDRFSYKPIKKTQKQFNVIKQLIQKRSFSNIIVATDAGREGEVIARTILLEAGFLEKDRIKRFWTSQALVPSVILKSMKNLKSISDYDRLWHAGYYRQVADWLVGMNLTRVLTVRLSDLYSVGRVQTAVLALLVDRKKERDTFVPETYWNIKATFSNEKGVWTGLWCKGNHTRITEKEKAQKLIDACKAETSPGSVLSAEKIKKRELPPLLFSLTDLQQEANKRFGFPAKKTLDIAQKLYQDRKCLSYPRTDSRVLGTQNLNLVKDILTTLQKEYPDILENVLKERVSLSNKRVFNDAKLTDHHALIPLKAISASAPIEEQKIFDLVLRRFCAAFHPDCEFEQTTVMTGFSGETFQTKGRVVLVSGWREVYEDFKKEKDAEEETGKNIPPLIAGDPAMLDNILSQEKKTQPPPAYTDSLLLKDMTNPGKYVDDADIKKLFRGDVGIGTQSTRAQIIETLIARKYARRTGKTIVPLEKGVFLVETLRKTTFSKVLTSPDETAHWEMALNRIALGEETNRNFLAQIKDFVQASVNELKTAAFDMAEVARTSEQSRDVGTCPSCGGRVMENFKAYGCSGKDGEKGCGFVIWKKISGKKISAKMAANLLRYRKSGPFKGFLSKKKKRFSASLKLENENGKWQVVFDFDGKKKTEAPGTIKKNVPAKNLSESLRCPKCGGKIIEGKRGFGCANFRPENGRCTFVIWKEIHGRKITEKNLADLLNGKTLRLATMTTPDGQVFKGRLGIDKKETGGFVMRVQKEGETTPSPELDVVLSFI